VRERKGEFVMENENSNKLLRNAATAITKSYEQVTEVTALITEFKGFTKCRKVELKRNY
jgi:hypothetical protein